MGRLPLQSIHRFRPPSLYRVNIEWKVRFPYVPLCYQEWIKSISSLILKLIICNCGFSIRWLGHFFVRNEGGNCQNEAFLNLVIRVRFSYSGYRCESDITLFKWKFTCNYNHSPFNFTLFKY